MASLLAVAAFLAVSPAALPDASVPNFLATVSAAATAGLSDGAACATVHLVDGSGNPLQAQWVELTVSAVNVSPGTLPFPDQNVSGTTDASGNGSLCYSLANAPPGQYKLYVSVVQVGQLLTSGGSATLTSNNVLQQWVTGCITTSCPGGAGPSSGPISGPLPGAAGRAGLGDLTVTVTPSSPTVYAGTPVTLTIVLSYSGTAGFSDLQFSSTDLPTGLSLLSAQTTAGSCTAVLRLVCDLGAVGTGAQITMTASVVVDAAGQFVIYLNGVQSGVGDHVGTSYTLVAQPPLPIAVPAPTPPTALPSTTPKLSLVAPRTLLLSGSRSSLQLTARTSIAGKLTLMLLASNGRQLARLSERVSAGKTRLSLVLPAKARHQGHDRLRISLGGSTTTATVPIIVIA